jgi:hypothetical protein
MSGSRSKKHHVDFKTPATAFSDIIKWSFFEDLNEHYLKELTMMLARKYADKHMLLNLAIDVEEIDEHMKLL